MRKKNVTITDIAEKTGYSKTTVSFAFNWPNRISSSAVSKIIECAKELGYQSDNEQLLEPSNRYKTICVIVPDINDVKGSTPIWAKAVLGIYKECATQGFMFSMIDQKRTTDSFFLKYAAVDAFMLLDDRIEPVFFEFAQKRRIPVIRINTYAPELVEIDLMLQIEKNAIDCAGMLFELVRNGQVSNDMYKAYMFFDKNR